MRLALIDLGTNAVRFDVHELSDREPRRLHRERLMVRLGERVFQGGVLSPAAVRRTLAAFDSFARTCRDLRVDKVAAFGTSALREASNSDKLLRQIRARAGIEVRVIPGAEEARLIAQGILAHEDVPSGPFAIVDVGGGSMEIILCQGGRMGRSVSLDLGVARLQQTFLKTVPPAPERLKDLRRHVKSALKAAAPRGGWPAVKEVVGSGGTIRALARLHEESGDGKLDAEALEKMAGRMAPMPLRRLLRVPGMEPKRAETILAGAALMAEVADALEAGEVRPTNFALRDGMLEEEIRLSGKAGGGPAGGGFDEAFVLEKARRLGSQVFHVRQVMALCAGLFDSLKPSHRLPPVWRGRLLTAAALHDAGEAVSPVHHERHSAYIALHADIPFLEPWEHELVSQLCLWHKGGKVQPGQIPFWGDGARRAGFLKVLSFLRIADALDRGHRSGVRLAGVSRRGRRVTLLLKGATDLELLRLDQKKELFEKVFKTSLSGRPA